MLQFLYLSNTMDPMKYLIYVLLLLLTACGGRLTDEQRKKLKEGMELNAIKKVSDAQLTEAAFEMGRSIAAIVEKSSLRNRKLVDSLERTYKIQIDALQQGDSMLLEIERQIVEAYSAGSGKIQLSDNIQRIGPDSLLYTKPIMKELADGSLQFSYALGIRLPRKQVVLSIKD